MDHLKKINWAYEIIYIFMAIGLSFLVVGLVAILLILAYVLLANPLLFWVPVIPITIYILLKKNNIIDHL